MSYLHLLLDAIKKFGQPVFFAIRASDRNSPLTVLDCSTGLEFLKRNGNEKADYVMIGFRLKQATRPSPSSTSEESK